ncbi:MAG TPA: hypothetical protein VL918_08030, partial [Sphingobium sp.]|nr:hypothetical protein [Sphingobium sp.]
PETTAKATSVASALTTPIATAEITTITAETFVAETVPLVLAAPAASSVKTHALLIAFVRPPLLDRTLDETHTEPPANISGQLSAITRITIEREHFNGTDRCHLCFAIPTAAAPCGKTLPGYAEWLIELSSRPP